MSRAMTAAMVLVLTAAAGTALADGVVRLNQGMYQAGSGGEFQMVRLSGDVGVLGGPNYAGNPADSFPTFCVEILEHVSFGGVYNAHVNTMAVGGSYGAGPDGDPIDPRTAFLYSSFRSGSLQGYAFNGTTDERRASALKLQQAIWYIEEPGAALGQNNEFVGLANNAGWTDLGDVRVLNLYVRNGDGSNGGHAQDQLTMVPLPPAATAGLCGLAMVMGGTYARRRRQRQD